MLLGCSAVKKNSLLLVLLLKNQKLLKLFTTVTGKQWLTTSDMFLLFDSEHLVKNIRNNWLTEATSELSFKFDDEKFSAKWSDLVQLYKLEEQYLSIGVK